MKIDELQDKVEKHISEYIEFDVRELFNQSDYITIYGGAVRDSIAGLEIHDVDILCMSRSAEKLNKYLKDVHGYERLDLYDIDTLNMYKGISLIAEPWTLMNKNKKIIQIIRPNYPSMNTTVNRAIVNYQEAYYNLIKNVDISCCGVFLENYSRIVLREACKNAIAHCLSKTFIINDWSKLYNNERTSYRAYKLKSRGWFDLNERISFPWDMSTGKKDVTQKERLVKMLAIEYNLDDAHKIWTSEEYQNRIADDIISTIEDL